MKKAWRWPLAGFVLGGLVGATFLTVNVVGASSPERDGVTVSSFGEILHTPPLLAVAGRQVELSYDPANPSDVRVPGSGGGLIQGVFLGIGILFAVLGVLLVAAAIAVGI